MSDIATSGELNIIKEYIKPNDIVIDVGANVGEWSLAVLNLYPNVTIAAFEPVPAVFNQLRGNLKKHKNAEAFNYAISNQNLSDKTFYFYREDSGLSTLHRRLIAEPQYDIKPPQEILVMTMALDVFCSLGHIKRIDFLKIDTEGNELNVLKSAEQKLKKNLIHFIQLEYGGAYLDSKTTLKEVWNFMSQFNFDMYKITPNVLVPIKKFTAALEDFTYCNFLLINKNFSK